MGTLTLIKGLMFIGLFTVAMITFAVNFAEQNDAAISLADDTELTSLSSDTATNIDGLASDTEKTYSSIIPKTVNPGSDVLPSPGPFTITTANSLSVSKNIMEVGYSRIFGTNTGFGVFLTALVSMVGLMLTLYIIKTWRGSPD